MEPRLGTGKLDMQNVCTCERCGLRYDWRRSPSSSLKMTYCGSLCERADLGFTIEAILNLRPSSGSVGGQVEVPLQIRQAARGEQTRQRPSDGEGNGR